MTESKPVAGYYRVSVARDNMHSPELYETEIHRYCSYKRLDLHRIFSDIDYSAFRGAKPRPSLEQLISERHDYSAVIVPKLSRFGRSMKELVKLFEIFDNDSIPLVFLDMNLDTSTSQGRLLRHILAAFAEYESDVKADYARASQRLIAQAGRPQGYMAPFGYLVVGRGRDANYAIDPDKGPILVEIFERYARGEFLASIAQDLNARDVRGVRGARMTRGQVRQLLDNPAYIGLRRYRRMETFPGIWEPLVSRELWDAVRARRASRRVVHERSPKRGMLSGLLVCGVCARRLTNHATNGKARQYECSHRVHDWDVCPGGAVMAERADRVVGDALVQLLGLVSDRELHARAMEIRTEWAAATPDDRRALLSEVIEKIELVARPASNRNGRGYRRGRPLKIYWRKEWSIDVFGHVGAFSVLGPGAEKITSPKGKTWAQWQRELRAAR